jgi:hypothetical protein
MIKIFDLHGNKKSSNIPNRKSKNTKNVIGIDNDLSDFLSVLLSIKQSQWLS